MATPIPIDDVQAKIAALPGRANLAEALREQAQAQADAAPDDDRKLWRFWIEVEDACKRECERINRQWGQFLGQRDRQRRATLKDSQT
jgi:hypothetical protein